MAFHIILEEIEILRSKSILGISFLANDLMETAQNIVELVFTSHGGWAFLQLGQHQQSFLQQLQQNYSFNLPQPNFFINQQIPPPAMIGQAPTQNVVVHSHVASAPTQNVVVHSHVAPAPAQIQGPSEQDKNELHLDRLNKENNHNEKMKNRYEDELAVKDRARLEAQEKKTIEAAEEKARKFKEAEERFERNKIENNLKEDTILRIDEAKSRQDELDRKTREMTERTEQANIDAARRFEQTRREAAAKREQQRRDEERRDQERRDQERRDQERRDQERRDQERRDQERQRQLDASRNRTNDLNNQSYNQQRMLPERERPRRSSPVPQNQLVSDDDDDDSDSDEEKRKDPYELIGLPDRGRTPVKDIETTQRVLNKIHQKTLDSAMSESKRQHAEKRMVEIKWAAAILLDEMNKRAYDEAGAIFPHEQQAWRKKSK
ncbi:uncharacterized protein J4E88_004960 [Alternaria novae-zelandiae]|uniref:uncharacterized protein n=1 Tax=Alternaria novae-zelandiae TaxID=430562 RepID=UPI0020C55B02|nr:uncharacterized protein J4E88_004960 [Alternaria novae-zelandiae]KAI4682072.1 hypothetical protein J4E88_004960 [Alternaria novae-zelandiae]